MLFKPVHHNYSVNNCTNCSSGILMIFFFCVKKRDMTNIVNAERPGINLIPTGVILTSIDYATGVWLLRTEKVMNGENTNKIR